MRRFVAQIPDCLILTALAIAFTALVPGVEYHWAATVIAAVYANLP